MIIPKEKAFFCSNGDTYYTVNQLLSALKNMDSNTYNYHVNSEKNDFANWVSDVFNKKQLAIKLRRKGKEVVLKKKRK